MVVTPIGRESLCIARIINENVAVVINMSSSTRSARLAARNRKLTAPAEVSLDVDAHQHSDAEMPRPVLCWVNRHFDPNVARRRNIELWLLLGCDQRHAGKAARRHAHDKVGKTTGGHW